MKKSIKIIASVVCLVALCAVLLTGCNKAETLKEDTAFYVNFVKVNFVDLGSDAVWKLLTSMLFDGDNTYIKLDKKGTVTINLKVREQIKPVLDKFEVDLSGISEMDLRNMANIYAAAILPGFAMEEGKLQESVELLRSLGGKLDLDFESDEVKALIESLETTGHVNEDFTIPKQVAINYQGKYEIKHLPSINGEKTIVFIDEYGDKGEPYLMLDLTTDEKTNLRTVHLRVDFLELDLLATEKAK